MKLLGRVFAASAALTTAPRSPSGRRTRRRKTRRPRSILPPCFPSRNAARHQGPGEQSHRLALRQAVGRSGPDARRARGHQEAPRRAGTEPFRPGQPAAGDQGRPTHRRQAADHRLGAPGGQLRLPDRQDHRHGDQPRGGGLGQGQRPRRPGQAGRGLGQGGQQDHRPSGPTTWWPSRFARGPRGRAEEEAGRRQAAHAREISEHHGPGVVRATRDRGGVAGNHHRPGGRDRDDAVLHGIGLQGDRPQGGPQEGRRHPDPGRGLQRNRRAARQPDLGQGPRRGQGRRSGQRQDRGHRPADDRGGRPDRADRGEERPAGGRGRCSPSGCCRRS